MNIHREDPQSCGEIAPKRIKECLNILELSDEFSEGLSWDTEIVKGLTIEGIIQTLVSAEQELL